MKLHCNGIDIRYDIQGSGPWITFAHSLASDLSMWDDQVAALDRVEKAMRLPGGEEPSALAARLSLATLDEKRARG